MTEATIGLGLMCKPPRPGVTKTRLAAAIGPAAATALSQAFLEDCARAALEATTLCRLEPTAFYRPDDAANEIGAILGPRWPLAHADAGDLGMTMFHVLRQLLHSWPAGAMIMGADVPLISGEAIASAARTLRESGQRGVVLIPSADGGYCLLGVRSVDAAAALCAPMEWSTPRVLQETLHRARAAGLTARLLPLQRDIDEVADLDWLRAQLRQGAQGASFTRKALADLDQKRGR
jgi:rSAM/selenodomain-associated transferase 1